VVDVLLSTLANNLFQATAEGINKKYYVLKRNGICKLELAGISGPFHSTLRGKTLGSYSIECQHSLEL
jgi:hypothetical protein